MLPATGVAGGALLRHNAIDDNTLFAASHFAVSYYYQYHKRFERLLVKCRLPPSLSSPLFPENT